MARLYATSRLVELALSPSSSLGPEHGMPRLQAVCKDNKTEENLNNLADDLDYKDFALSPGKCPVGRYVGRWLGTRFHMYMYHDRLHVP